MLLKGPAARELAPGKFAVGQRFRIDRVRSFVEPPARHAVGVEDGGIWGSPCNERLCWCDDEILRLRRARALGAGPIREVSGKTAHMVGLRAAVRRPVDEELLALIEAHLRRERGS